MSPKNNLRARSYEWSEQIIQLILRENEYSVLRGRQEFLDTVVFRSIIMPSARCVMTERNSFAVTYGELLVDMAATPLEKQLSVDGFFGGAPANTAVGLAKLGVPTSFIGQVGNDVFGKFLKGFLDENDVDTSQLILTADYPTTLAVVSIESSGARDFAFYPGAHDKLTPESVNFPTGARLLHFGSLLQISSEADAATSKLIDQARREGAVISYDPNFRAPLWGDKAKAKQKILETAEEVDLMKVSDDEAELLTGSRYPKDAARSLFRPGMDALFITLGKDGCYYKTQAFEGYVPVPIKVDVVDTTGAGDAFNAGYILAMHESGVRFSERSQEEVEEDLRRANRIAAMTTTQKGATSAFPSRQDLLL